MLNFVVALSKDGMALLDPSLQRTYSKYVYVRREFTQNVQYDRPHFGINYLFQFVQSNKKFFSPSSSSTLFTLLELVFANHSILESCLTYCTQKSSHKAKRNSLLFSQSRAASSKALFTSFWHRLALLLWQNRRKTYLIVDRRDDTRQPTNKHTDTKPTNPPTNPNLFFIL